jgi:micrococcal nuclease
MNPAVLRGCLQLLVAIAPARLGLPPTAEPGVVSRQSALEQVSIERVVDGDTLWVERAGRTEKLRLACVDTEEKISGHSADPTKPETVFGQETALWAQEFFAELAADGARPRVGLVLPGGREERDIYGRLLAHVFLPDGRDYNVLLVRSGRSPYFNKYGNSELCHAAFVEAQRAARAEQLGIWNPSTNRARAEGEPSAVRPYDRLLPWWDARAAAIDAQRRARAAARAGGPATPVDCDTPGAVAAALAADDSSLEVFGCVEQVFEEQSGDLTLLLRGPSRDEAVRAIVPRASRAALAELALERRADAFVQNYVIVRGAPRTSPRGGWQIEAGDRAAWRLAGPEPVAPIAPGAPGAAATGDR